MNDEAEIEQEVSDDESPEVPTDLLELAVSLDDLGISPEEFKDMVET